MIDLKKLWESMPPDVVKKISLHDLKRICDTYNGGPTFVTEAQCYDLYQKSLKPKPVVDDYLEKLIALLEGLELINRDEFLRVATIESYKRLGMAIEEKINLLATENELMKQHFGVDVRLIRRDSVNQN